MLPSDKGKKSGRCLFLFSGERGQDEKSNKKSYENKSDEGSQTYSLHVSAPPQ